MREIIKSALDEAFEALKKQTPQTKKEGVFVSLTDVDPFRLTEFMVNNKIPDTAYFGGKDNGYDGFSEIGLCYFVDVPTTGKDQLIFNRKRFTSIAFPLVSKALTATGLSRQSFSSHLFKRFDDTTVFDMYKDGNFERLEQYYSMYFK